MIDGHIDPLRSMIHFGEGLSQSSQLAKGFFIYTLDMDGAGVELANQMFWQKQNMLLNLAENISIQVQFSVTNDYRDLLKIYEDETNRMERIAPWVKFCRIQDRLAGFKEAMERGSLRRERTAMFVNLRCLDLPKKAGQIKGEYIAQYLDRASQTIDNYIEGIGNALKFSRIEKMDTGQLERYLREWFQPSIGAKSISAPVTFYPVLSIRENLETTGATFIPKEGFFVQDGLYHCIIITRTWPQESTPYKSLHLTRLLDRDIRVTQTIFTVDKAGVLANEKQQLKFSLNRSREEPSNVDERVKAQMRELRVEKLVSGGVKPHFALTVIHFWASSADELRHRRLLVLDGMTNWGAVWKEPTISAQTYNTWMSTLPGFAPVDRFEWGVYASSEELAGFIPMASGYQGDAHLGHSLYDTPKGGVLGIACFLGDVPLHTFLTGRTRSGKSMFLVDFNSQTAGIFAFIATIDRGNTHGLSTRLIGMDPADPEREGQTFRFGPSTKHVINYFDTQGAPLTRVVKQTATSLIVRMAGYGPSSSETEQMRVSAIINHYVNGLYESAYATWAKNNEQGEKIARRTAFLIEQLKTEDRAFAQLGQVEAFSELKSRDPAWVDERINAIEEAELIRWMENPFNRGEVMNLAFAFFKREDFPTHSKLVEFMSSMPSHKHDPREIGQMADILANWTRKNGNYGIMFDGYTNVDLMTSRAVHCELGDIPDDRADMQQVAYFLVTGFLRQRILSMPRRLKKRIIFEEIGTFAKLPAGASIMAESASQFAKCGCQCVFVAQQYSQIAQTAVKSVVIGNCDNYIIFAQNDKSDLLHMQEDIGLPDSAVRSILGFNIPAVQREATRGAYFLLMRKGDGQVTGVGVNRVTPHMIYAGASAGALYDEQAQLDTYVDENNRKESLFDAVLAETDRLLINKNKEDAA